MRKPAKPGLEDKIDVPIPGTPPRAYPEKRPAADASLMTELSWDQTRDHAEQSDAWLVDRARNGHDQAFGILVKRYERKLIRVLTRLVRDPEHARDLAQETFWRVHQRLDQFDASRRFGPWLFRVAINLGLDWLRRLKLENSVLSTNLRDAGRARFESADPDPLIRAELAQEVQLVLSRLPASYRTILILRDLEGFSTSEVAAIVGRREPTIRWRLALARQRFREIWQSRNDRIPDDSKDGNLKREPKNE